MMLVNLVSQKTPEALAQSGSRLREKKLFTSGKNDDVKSGYGPRPLNGSETRFLGLKRRLTVKDEAEKGGDRTNSVRGNGNVMGNL